MAYRGRNSHTRLMCGAAMLALLGSAGVAAAEEVAKFNIAPQPLASALNEFAVQSPWPILYTTTMTGGKTTAGVKDASDPEVALNTLLDGTGLSYRREGDTFLIVGASDPQSGSAAGDGADGTVEALIVTAQKREEDIQDVPIAISAFTQEALEAQKIEGGFDLLKAIPNVTFSKNNFTSYNFSIRGVGTKAISATTDPGVAVSFNNVPLIQNRLFEQEYFDIERVEVLRGPQGTLYGRNATAGVINVISAKPDMNEFEGWMKGEVGNYQTKRLSGMLNVPILTDTLAVRLAGALTQREGFDYNALTQNAVNGRDLWSTRLTIGFDPTDNIHADLIWEHFNEDDNRSRTGKQLCKRDDGPDMMGSTPTNTGRAGMLRKAMFSQGCVPVNLYDDSAFETPNGLALPFVFAILVNGGPGGAYVLHRDDEGNEQTFLRLADPYANLTQSRDLRTIESLRDPTYRAKTDLFELNVEADIGDNLTFVSQTAYNEDEVYSAQDFNRFNTRAVFEDTSAWTEEVFDPEVGWFVDVPSPWQPLTPNGVFCDPQLGCSDTMVGYDISKAKSEQFGQEFRLQSDFDGPFNFSLGANYTRFEVLVDYYVLYNILSAYALTPPFNVARGDQWGPDLCGFGTAFFQEALVVDIDTPGAGCPYVDPNPIENMTGEGHNYFRSKNPYKLESAAAFGEAYWNVSDAVKLTAGLRYTDDRKTFTPVPSQILLAPTFFAGGAVNIGYPALPDIKQHWGEWTGRLGVDWKPELALTDETMVYAFYSHGYKGGGANPPSPGFATVEELTEILLSQGYTQDTVDAFIGFGMFPVLKLSAAEYGPTFEPEYVEAFEIGAKNRLLGGALTFNASAFLYDYKDYQVSQIRDRTAVNENFDAKIWGVEFEGAFAPSSRLQVVANLGYLDTRIADGESSIDIMNRTQGDPNYVVAKPWMQMPSNCVVPKAAAEAFLNSTEELVGFWGLCGGYRALGSGFQWIDPAFNAPYDVANYPQLNGGAGLRADLSGNELPNSPHWTANIGVQYVPIETDGWRLTLRGDAYWQSQSWARVYNADPYDKLHGWYNLNLSAWLDIPDHNLRAEFYVKNVLDRTPITDAFLNSDDTALTTNVFVLDPRLIGLSVRKSF